jgi:O-antigen ligase
MIIKYNHIAIIAIILLIISQIVNASIITLFFNIPSSLVQIILYGTLIFVLLFSLKNIRIELMMLGILTAILFSILLSDANARYNIETRFITWLLLVATVGPLLYNPQLIRLRYKLFEAFMMTFMILGGLSALYWFAGIPSFGRGHFSGLLNHSMLLAPIASIGGIYAFHRFTLSNDLKTKYIFLALTILNALDVLLAASRSALAGFILALTALLFFNKFKYRKFILILGILTAIFIFVQPDDNRASMKNEGGLTGELSSRGTVNTREDLWNDRLREFNNNPIFGVGFAAQEDKLAKGNKAGKGGQVEPGSTYLMILSMTGSMGAIALFVFFLKPLLSKQFWRYMLSPSVKYKLAIFIFFSIHFIAEGYIYSSGSLMAFVFWLLVGSTYPYSNTNYQHDFKGNLQ